MLNKEEMIKLVPEIENLQLDVPLMLLYKRNYAIVQSGGELLVFELHEGDSETHLKANNVPQSISFVS